MNGLPQVKFVGHSLGGGLASAAARSIGSNASTYNASGLNKHTVEQIPPGGKINAFYVKGEILTSAQMLLPIPEAAKDNVTALDPPFNMSRDILPVIGGMIGSVGALAGITGGVAVGLAIRGIFLHLMGSVHASLDRALVNATANVKQACG